MFVPGRGRERSVDTVDLELDRLLTRRASQDRTPDPDTLEASYAEFVRRFNTRRRTVNRDAWVNYHLDQAQRHRAVLEDLVSHHEREAERLRL